MSRPSRLQRATGALQAIADPFTAMTSLLFLAAAHSESAGGPLSDVTGPNPDATDINTVLRAIEEQFPEHLHGALAVPRLAALSPQATGTAIEHIQTFLDRRESRDRDIFGAAFMEGQGLSARQRLGAFHTPDTVGAMIGQIVDCEPCSWLLEPSRGSGALILAMIDRARARHGPQVAASITIVGVELDPRSARLARMNMVLAGAAEHTHIFCGDALAREIVAPNPQAGGDHQPVGFHSIIANPPFGAKVDVADLRDPEPFVIPDRLLDREVAVPSGWRPEQAAPVSPVPAVARIGEQLTLALPDAA